MAYDAIAFDTGGTVLDWHGSLVDELAQFAPWQGLRFDAHEFVNDWRRRTMKGIVGQAHPAFHMDDVHLGALDESIRTFGLPTPAERDRLHLWHGWHRLRAWPDFAPALAALRQALLHGVKRVRADHSTWTVTTTRRFCARPSALALSATGLSAP